LFIFLVVYFVFDFVLCFDCLPQSRDYSNAIVLMNSAASSDQFKSILIAHVKKYQNTVYKFMPYTSVSRNLDVAPAPEVGNVFIFTERVKELPPKTSFEDCVRNYSDCCVIVNPTNYN
jgi:hypothetical protein